MVTIENPPGTPVLLSDNSLTTVGTIAFNNQLDSTELLPPLVQASLNDAGVFNVSAIIYVDASITHLESFFVTGLYNLSSIGKPQFQFYISANLNAGSTNPIGTTHFTGFQINFEAPTGLLPDNVTLSEIRTVETFLWDKDPKTSRGTVTNVIHAT